MRGSAALARPAEVPAAWATRAERSPRVLRRARPVRRVLMTTDAVGGVWQYALTLGAGLRARGVEVVLAVLGPPPDDSQRARAARTVEALVELPGRLEWMTDPWTDVAQSGQRLLELERSIEPDIVHLNGFCHAALSWRAPVVVVGHSCVRSWWRAVRGTTAPPHWDRYGREVTRGLTAARMVVAPTAAMLRAVDEEYGGLRAAARVIPNACVAGQPRRTTDKQDIVLTAGRAWDEAKNVACLDGIAAGLPWPVYLAGDVRDPDGRGLPPGSLRCLGRLDEDEIGQWYGRAAIYALPARYEPFGLSVLEAAAAGCALVLGDLPSLRENWSGAALFVPPDSRVALAAALGRLIEDRRLRESLGEEARRRAERFTVQRMAEGYLQAYGELLAEEEA